MCKYLYVADIRIPAYGLMIILGIVLCNALAQLTLKNDLKKMQNYYLTEIISGLGAVIGAKMLTMFVDFCTKGEMPTSIECFKKAGYSYYGGLAGFLLFANISCKLLKVDSRKFAQEYIYLLPILHMVWKIGCLMAGCCFGIPYDGTFSVCYAEGINSLAGIEVFPVQILESIVALIIAGILMILKKKVLSLNPVGTYLFLYGITRFFIEFLRYHDVDSFISIAQICSIISVVIGGTLIYKDFRRKMINE